MKEEFIALNVVKNDENNRFELTVDGFTAFIDFIKENDNVIKLIHTESPPELAGRGVATALIEKTLIYLEENNYKLIPLCPLVFAYIKRHLEWKRIVDESFNGFKD
ncbi:MAG: GNAT family N-acetyltransferase [Myroides sp.]